MERSAWSKGIRKFMVRKMYYMARRLSSIIKKSFMLSYQAQFKERLRLALDAMPVPVSWTCLKDQKIELMNRKVYDITKPLSVIVLYQPAHGVALAIKSH